VFAEVYDLEPGSKYTLRFELEEEAGGRRTLLDFKPWDGPVFGGEALRVAPLEGPALEHAVLDLSDVGPGSYTLRMRIEAQDGRSLVRERTGVGRSDEARTDEDLRVTPGFF
jgi:hypothetical protein